MSYQALSWALDVRGLPAASKLVLVQLANRHNPDLGCFPSIKKISDDCEMCVRSVHRHLKFLESRNLIKKKSRFSNGRHTSNEYLLNLGVTDLLGGRVTNLHPPSDTGVTPINSNSKIIIKKSVHSDEYFDCLFNLWPKKERKALAKDEFEKTIQTDMGLGDPIDDRYIIIKKAESFIETFSPHEIRFVPQLHKWLKEKRWLDEITETPLHSLTTKEQMKALTT